MQSTTLCHYVTHSAHSISYETECNLSLCLSSSNLGSNGTFSLKNSSRSGWASMVAKNCSRVMDQLGSAGSGDRGSGVTGDRGDTVGFPFGSSCASKSICEELNEHFYVCCKYHPVLLIIMYVVRSVTLKIASVKIKKATSLYIKIAVTRQTYWR